MSWHGTKTRRGLRTDRRDACRTKSRGFTLIELLVVMAMISLILGIALPSVFGLFNAGADAQAYNQLSAMLMMARAYAIQNNTYAGVHVQMVDNLNANYGHPDLAGTCYAAVVYCRNVATPGNPPLMRFVLLPGQAPALIVGGMAFGDVSHYFAPSGVNGIDDYQNLYLWSDSGGNDSACALLEDFCNFTIVFSPSGSLVKQVEGQNVVFAYNESTTDGAVTTAARTLFFDSSQPVDNRDNRSIWDIQAANDMSAGGLTRNRKGDGGDGEPGATALTMFRYAEVYAAATPAARAATLNRIGQFLPINVYTGQPFRRQ